MIIRSSSHSTKFANTGKQEDLQEFLVEYNQVKWELVDYLWNTKIVWGKKKLVLDIQNNKLNCPDYLAVKNIPIETNLSARAMKSASDEALGIISSAISKRSKQLYILSREHKDGNIDGMKQLIAEEN